MLNKSDIYPSVAPRSYVQEVGEAACSYADLGPNLVVMLSLDLNSAIRNVSPPELIEANLTEDQAWDAAWANFGRELSEGRLQLQVAEYEDGGKAALFGGHWLASAAIFHSGLYGWFREQLGMNDLFALVSERDSAIIFSENCSVFVREHIESFASQTAAFSRKPFGLNLFRLLDGGPEYVRQGATTPKDSKPFPK